MTSRPDLKWPVRQSPQGPTFFEEFTDWCDDETRAEWVDGCHRLAFDGDAGVYRSQVLAGFWLVAEWLWQDPPPRLFDVSRQLGLLP